MQLLLIKIDTKCEYMSKKCGQMLEPVICAVKKILQTSNSKNYPACNLLIMLVTASLWNFCLNVMQFNIAVASADKNNLDYRKKTDKVELRSFFIYSETKNISDIFINPSVSAGNLRVYNWWVGP